MMEATERHEIGRFGLAAMRPMLGVMPIDVASVRATGKATSAIARVERTAQRWRNASGPPHIQRLAMLVLHDRHDAAITREAASGFGGQGGAFLDLASTGDAIAERLRIYVHDDLLAFATIRRLAAMLEEALSEYAQCIGTTSRVIRPLIR